MYTTPFATAGVDVLKDPVELSPVGLHWLGVPRLGEAVGVEGLETPRKVLDVDDAVRLDGRAVFVGAGGGMGEELLDGGDVGVVDGLVRRKVGQGRVVSKHRPVTAAEGQGSESEGHETEELPGVAAMFHLDPFVFEDWPRNRSADVGQPVSWTSTILSAVTVGGLGRSQRRGHGLREADRRCQAPFTPARDCPDGAVRWRTPVRQRGLT